MHVTVTYNVKSYDFFFKPIFLEFPHLKQSLLDDFSAYKATNQLPHYFGRDTDYARPADIQGSGLMHIHLGLHENKLLTPQGKQIDSSTPQWDPQILLCYMLRIYLMKINILLSLSSTR